MGYITGEDLKKALVNLKFTDDAWKCVVEDIDKNKDGIIMIEEFEKMLTTFNE